MLSEGAASLLPDQVRPALLWTVRLDARGQMTDAEVVRALVRSREQLSYDQAQAEIDGGSPRETLALLAEVGPWREQREVDRGGVSLQIPEQEIVDEPWPDGDPGWRLVYRASAAGRGLERADLAAHRDGRGAHHALRPGRACCGPCRRPIPGRCAGCGRRPRRWGSAGRPSWTTRTSSAASTRPSRGEAAMLNACTTLFRGAGYQAFSGGVPEEAEHAALAIDYAHVTAPLRRLVDRYAGEICVALCADQPVPDWVLRSAGRAAGGDGEGRAAGQEVRAGDHRPGRGVPAPGPGR